MLTSLYTFHERGGTSSLYCDFIFIFHYFVLGNSVAYKEAAAHSTGIPLLTNIVSFLVLFILIQAFGCGYGQIPILQYIGNLILFKTGEINIQFIAGCDTEDIPVPLSAPTQTEILDASDTPPSHGKNHSMHCRCAEREDLLPDSQNAVVIHSVQISSRIFIVQD